MLCEVVFLVALTLLCAVAWAFTAAAEFAALSSLCPSVAGVVGGREPAPVSVPLFAGVEDEGAETQLAAQAKPAKSVVTEKRVVDDVRQG